MASKVNTNIGILRGSDDMAVVAASATDQVCGTDGGTTGGAIGDWLSHVTIVPTSTSPGAVSIKDGSGSAITIFDGGASSLSNLAPFTVALGATSKSGAWSITTGANVKARAFGEFS